MTLPAPEHTTLLAAVRSRMAGAVSVLSARRARTAVESDALWDRVGERAVSAAEALGRGREEAAALLAELLRSPRDERAGRVAREERFHSLALAELLLARREEDRQNAECSNLCVFAIAGALGRETGAGVADNVLAAAWAERGNLLRLKGDLAGAERAFLAAARQLARSPEPLEEARLHARRALLLLDQGKLAVAVRLQQRAVNLLSRFGRPRARCTALVDLAGLAAQNRAPRVLTAALRQASTLMSEDGEARGESLSTLRRAALGVAAAGYGHEAGALVAAASELWAAVLSPAERAQLLATAGSVARAAGRKAEAVQLMEHAWEQLCDHGAAGQAAAALLEEVSLLTGEREASQASALLGAAQRRLIRLPLRPGARAALDLAAVALAKEHPPAGLIEELAIYARGAAEA